MIDINKTYRTRDWNEVRIYATDGGGSHPVHGAVKRAAGWVCYSWMRGGSWARYESPNDLIEGPCDPVEASIKRAVWVGSFVEQT
jgi:hypothetical protein